MFTSSVISKRTSSRIAGRGLLQLNCGHCRRIVQTLWRNCPRILAGTGTALPCLRIAFLSRSTACTGLTSWRAPLLCCDVEVAEEHASQPTVGRTENAEISDRLVRYASAEQGSGGRNDRDHMQQRSLHKPVSSDNFKLARRRRDFSLD
jgi:hypothetical protein